LTHLELGAFFGFGKQFADFSFVWKIPVSGNYHHH